MWNTKITLNVDMKILTFRHVQNVSDKGDLDIFALHQSSVQILTDPHPHLYLGSYWGEIIWTTAAPFLQYDYKHPPPPPRHLWGTETRTVSLVPNGLQKQAQKKRRVCCCHWSWNGFTKQRNNTARSGSRWDTFTYACSGFLGIFFVCGFDPDRNDKCKIPQPAAL